MKRKQIAKMRNLKYRVNQQKRKKQKMMKRKKNKPTMNKILFWIGN